MVTFPVCAGTKFILLGDSWLPRILILLHTCLDLLDIISRPHPESYPGRYCWSGQRACTWSSGRTRRHATAMLNRQPPHIALGNINTWFLLTSKVRHKLVREKWRIIRVVLGMLLIVFKPEVWSSLNDYKWKEKKQMVACTIHFSNK